MLMVGVLIGRMRAGTAYDAATQSMDGGSPERLTTLSQLRHLPDPDVSCLYDQPLAWTTPPIDVCMACFLHSNRD